MKNAVFARGRARACATSKQKKAGRKKRRNLYVLIDNTCVQHGIHNLQHQSKNE